LHTGHKIEEIQVLRVIAVLLVVVFHAQFDLTGTINPHLNSFYAYFGGDAGVDLFFVISGYVIARGLIPSLNSTPCRAEQKNILLTFWIKRFFRLIPSAWFWLLFTLFCTRFFNESGAFGHFRAAYEGTLAAILNVANVRFMECFGKFECGPTFVYWSLSLEEQFYLILPILALLARRYITTVLIFLIISQIPETTSVLPGFRFTGLALGVLIAIFTKNDNYKWLEPTGLAKMRWLALSIFAFLLLILATILGSGLNVVTGTLKYDLISLPAALLVLLASYDRGYLIPPSAIRGLLVWIGERSCAIYLTHIPAYYLVREFLHDTSISSGDLSQRWIVHAALSGALILIFSELSFRFIEVPLQRKGMEWIKQRKLRTAVSESEVRNVQQNS